MQRIRHTQQLAVAAEHIVLSARRIHLRAQKNRTRRPVHAVHLPLLYRTSPHLEGKEAVGIGRDLVQLAVAHNRRPARALFQTDAQTQCAVGHQLAQRIAHHRLVVETRGNLRVCFDDAHARNAAQRDRQYDVIEKLLHGVLIELVNGCFF
jgi:hypothetical protein